MNFQILLTSRSICSRMSYLEGLGSEYSFNHPQLVEVLNTDEKEETEKRVEERVSLSRTGTNGKIKIRLYSLLCVLFLCHCAMCCAAVVYLMVM